MSIRFEGKEAEPRKIPSGHIPTAINVPASLLAPNGTLVSQSKLLEMLERRNVDLDKPMVTMCGSGVNASLLLFALVERGLASEASVALYDGSWTEWAMREADGALIESRGPKVSVSGGWLH